MQSFNGLHPFTNRLPEDQRLPGREFAIIFSHTYQSVESRSQLISVSIPCPAAATTIDNITYAVSHWCFRVIQGRGPNDDGSEIIVKEERSEWAAPMKGHMVFSKDSRLKGLTRQYSFTAPIDRLEYFRVEVYVVTTGTLEYDDS